jgi:hypothetical protein
LPNSREPGSIRRVAERVLTSIREDELYVFTHPELRTELEERFAVILAALDEASAL